MQEFRIVQIASHAVREKIQRCTRGYSDDDLTRARRIVEEGVILPIDIHRYRMERARKLGGMHVQVFDSTDIALPIFVPTAGFYHELHLPDRRIASELRLEASTNLASWLRPA